MKTIKKMLGFAKEDAGKLGTDLSDFLQMSFWVIVICSIYAGIPSGISTFLAWLANRSEISQQGQLAVFLTSFILAELVIVYISRLFLRAIEDNIDNE